MTESGRRRFLIGAGTLISFAALSRFKDHLAAHGRPLVEAPADPEHVLYVHPDHGYLLTLDNTLEEDPALMSRLTWRQIIWDREGWTEDYAPTKAQWRDVREVFPMTKRTLDKPWNFEGGDTAHRAAESLWIWRLCPSARAYRFLADATHAQLHGRGGGEEHGGLEFSIGTANGESKEVYLLDGLSASLLQETLNNTGHRVAVRMVG